MLNVAFRMLGRHAMHRVLAKQAPTGRMDFRFGMKLWRDRRVPAKAKIQALLLSLLAMFFLNVLEIPAEAILLLALPMLGIPIDIAWNGLENIVGPILFMGWMLPRLTPKPIVEQILREEAGPVIDVQHYSPKS